MFGWSLSTEFFCFHFWGKITHKVKRTCQLNLTSGLLHIFVFLVGYMAFKNVISTNPFLCITLILLIHWQLFYWILKMRKKFLLDISLVPVFLTFFTHFLDSHRVSQNLIISFTNYFFEKPCCTLCVYIYFYRKVSHLSVIILK